KQAPANVRRNGLVQLRTGSGFRTSSCGGSDSFVIRYREADRFNSSDRNATASRGVPSAAGFTAGGGSWSGAFGRLPEWARSRIRRVVSSMEVAGLGRPPARSAGRIGIDYAFRRTTTNIAVVRRLSMESAHRAGRPRISPVGSFRKIQYILI